MELGAEEKCVARADKLQESHQLCRPLTRAAACALEPACMDAATAQAEAPAPCGHTSITGNFQTKFFWFLGFFFFLWLHPQHVEVPKLGVKKELQLRATPQP